MIKIEGDYIIFSSGKRLESKFGVVALDKDGTISLLDYRDLMDPILSDKEKWELARYMIESWMSVRDRLWSRHEDSIKREEPVEEKALPLYDFNNAIEKEGEITGGPKCSSTTCLSYEEMMKDGCELPTQERDLCKTWQAIASAAKGVGIEGGGKDSIRYSEIGARETMNKVMPCPQCTSDTIIGMSEEGPDLWKVLEPRYCPVCGWKEGQATTLSEKDVNDRLFGNFEIDPKEKRLHELAKEYYRRCKDYDNLVCTGGKGPGGGVMPANDEERIKIGINASAALALVQKKGKIDGIFPSEIMKAI